MPWYPAQSSDLGFPETPVLNQRILADFNAVIDDHTALLGWKPLSASQSGVSWQLNDGSHGNGAGRSLHLSYQISSPPASPDIPEAAGELGLMFELQGLNAADFDHVALWIRGNPEEGFNPEFEVQFRRQDPVREGMQEVGRFRVGGMTDQWKRVIIPLNDLMGIKDWSRLDAFAFSLPVHEMRVRQGGYFIDDIMLIKTGNPGPSANDRIVAEKKKAWEEAMGGEVATRPLLKARLVGWPSLFLNDISTLPKDDREFLLRLARDTWRGLDALTDRHHGLPLDRVAFSKDSIAPETSRIGDYTSVTNIGLYFLAVVSAYELQLISREQALEKLTLTLTTLGNLETSHGFFYNYYNTTTLERASNFLSFVDSSWLTAGLIVVRTTFSELASRCTGLIEQGDYRFFYDPEHQLMSLGYYVNMGQRSADHYGVFYAESRIGSLIAMGKGEVAEEHWFSMVRTFPVEFQWQSSTPLNRVEKTVLGFRWIDGYYQWREYRYVPSWGGSLFEALMPALVLDELSHAPQSLGYNDRVHTAIHRLYALEELRFPVWGMSSSSTPGSDRYDEYGIKFLGSAGYRSGIVTPHASALALSTEPREAMANLRKLAELYPIYGDFGFYDAVNPATGEVAYHYLSLDQAMILVALANHLADHAVQKRFASDPMIQKVLPLLGIEKFVE
jgi:hypothetical protein